MGPTATPDPHRRTRWTKVDAPVASGGDVGGDLQATEAYSVRFLPAEERADGLHAAFTDYWYGEATGQTHRDGPFRVARQREYLICTDPRDPGSTEVWADYAYHWPGGRYGTTAEADAAARARAEDDSGTDIRWDGRTTFASPVRTPRWADLDLAADESLDMMPVDPGRGPDIVGGP